MHFALSLRIVICSVLLLFFKQAFLQKNDNNIQCESFKGIVSKVELNDEIKEKMQHVEQFLSNEKLEGILLSKNNNFSWITAGIGDNHILITSAIGDASVLIMKGGKRALSFDTFILTKDGIVNITKADGWPVIPITVNGKVYDMPDILTR